MKSIKRRGLTVFASAICLCFSICFSVINKAQNLPEKISVILGIKTVNSVVFDDITGLPIPLNEMDKVSYSFQVMLADTNNISSLKIRLGTSPGIADVYDSDENYSAYTTTSKNLYRNGVLLRNNSTPINYKGNLYYELSVHDLAGNCSHKTLGTFND